jgi:hypothetical protein
MPRQRRRGGVVGPLVLIFVGAVFLLQNTGYLPPNFWMSLWRFWPLVLVLVGIELLLAHRVPWLALAALAAVILIGGAVAAKSTSTTPASAAPPSTLPAVVTDLGAATQAAVTVRYGAGQLNVGPIEPPSQGELASMTYQGPSEQAPVPHYAVSSGGTGQLEYQGSGRGGPGGFFPFGGSRGASSTRMDVSLAPDVPISSLIIQAGAADAHLDLSMLRVSSLDLSIGATTAWLRFSEAAGTTNAHISGGASTITLEIPQGVAAQIQQRGGLSTFNIDRTRFPQVSEGQYRSADYDTAANKLNINIETGVTTIQVN